MIIRVIEVNGNAVDHDEWFARLGETGAGSLPRALLVDLLQNTKLNSENYTYKCVVELVDQFEFTDADALDRVTKLINGVRVQTSRIRNHIQVTSRKRIPRWRMSSDFEIVQRALTYDITKVLYGTQIHFRHVAVEMRRYIHSDPKRDTGSERLASELLKEFSNGFEIGQLGQAGKTESANAGSGESTGSETGNGKQSG